MTQRVGIINYNIGNIGSVKRSLDFFDTNYLMVNNAKDLKKCDKIVKLDKNNEIHILNYEEISRLDNKE